MSVDIKIPDHHLPKFKEVYRSMYLDFKARWLPLMKEWDELYPILKKLGILDEKGDEMDIQDPKSNQNSHRVQTEVFDLSSGENGQYIKRWTWAKKIEYVIKAAGRPLSSVEIIDSITSSYEPELAGQNLINSIPATLSVAIKNGEKFIRKPRSNGEYEYDLKK